MPTQLDPPFSGKANVTLTNANEASRGSRQRSRLLPRDAHQITTTVRSEVDRLYAEALKERGLAPLCGTQETLLLAQELDRRRRRRLLNG